MRRSESTGHACYRSASTKMSWHRGAKVAMVVALRSPQKIGALVSVDNAPVNAVLKDNFPKYIQSMVKIEHTKIGSQAEADNILKEVEEVLNSWLKLVESSV